MGAFSAAKTIALYVFTTIVVYLFQAPVETLQFSDALSASMFFVSNFYFLITDSNYFVTSSMNPLLHTWSLSMEEQYYLLIPLLLVRTKSHFKLFLGFFVISFLLGDIIF